MKNFLFLFIVILLLPFNSSGQSAIYSAENIHHPIIGQKGMVATQHIDATKVGLEILKKGGNAIDAAVAVGFSLAVVLPRAGNLGGGGFMLLHSVKENKTTAINYREMAPSQSTETMYLDKDGNVDNAKFNLSFHSIGVPGTVAGMVRALDQYGTMKLDEVLAPAIKLAEEGFIVTYDLAHVLKSYAPRLRKWKETEQIFYKGHNGFYEAGDTLKQTDLAWSLRQIAKHGSAAFYTGEIAKRISSDVLENGGIITLDDLRNYKAEEIEPVWGTYRGHDIASMPPPSSGGIHVIQMLNILEKFPLQYLGHNSAETLHLMTETMKLAYADRSEHLGDPAFWDVPTNGLSSKLYADLLRIKINRYRSTPATEIAPGNPQDYESEQTTHFSIVDSEGNVVSNTYTLNFSFGTGIVAKGTGILLNNEMGDFSAKPGSPNAFGLLGGQANAVQAGKRPLSAMTPTFVFKDKKPYIVTGSPGGSKIITTVLQVILNVIDHNMNVADATHAPRIHHQWYPDFLQHEKGISHDTKIILIGKGHNLRASNNMGSTQTIMIKNGYFFGSSDPRRPDAKTLGY